MTWIKTVSMEDDDRVKKAMLAQRAVYPIEYATPVHPENDGQDNKVFRLRTLRFTGPVIEHVGRIDAQIEAVDRDDNGQQQQQQRERGKPETLPARRQHAQADAQERGEQDEVVEVAQEADIGRNPANAEQLEEEHRKGEEKDAHTGISNEKAL